MEEKEKTPENLTASLDKEHNSAEPLHTTQANRKEVKEIMGGTEENTPYSNKNIENYLGSEKIDEKLSTQIIQTENERKNSAKDKDNNEVESDEVL